MFCGKLTLVIWNNKIAWKNIWNNKIAWKNIYFCNTCPQMDLQAILYDQLSRPQTYTHTYLLIYLRNPSIG